MTMKRLTISALVLVVLLAIAIPAMAEDIGSLTDRAVTNRIAYIQHALDDGQKPANLWWYGWLIGYTAATAGQLAARSGTDDEKQRQDMLVGAATTALGAVGQIALPMEAGRLPARLRGMADDTPEARRVKLVAAEEFLRRSAARETLGRSWQTHAIAGAVNLAAGLVIWRHYDRSASDGLLTFAVGQLVSEIQIFTQPTKAVRDLRTYEQRSGWEQADAAATSHRTWYVGIGPRRVVVGCSF
jgi:hypothetical protein